MLEVLDFLMGCDLGNVCAVTEHCKHSFSVCKILHTLKDEIMLTSSRFSVFS
jgi:hypothetical protein